MSFDQNVGEQFVDAFRPLNEFKWRLQPGFSESDLLHERIPNTARHAFSRSIVDSFREASLELPILTWLQERRGFLSDLVINSVGSVKEQSVSPLDVSYREAERSWWSRAAQRGGFSCGLRPLRTNPYAFMSFAIWDGDALLMSGLFRYYFHNFADHRLEVALSLPLATGLAFDVGTQYEFGGRRPSNGMAVKLVKQLSGGGVAHIGLEWKQSPAIIAAVTIPM